MPIKKGTVEVEKIYRADYNYLIGYLNWNGGTTTKSELLSSLDWEFRSSKDSIYNALNWDGAIPSDLPEVKRVDYKGSQIFPTQYTVTFKTGWDGATISTQTINKFSNAVFPSVSYGTGYQSNGYSGSYTNIQSNTTITINRKPIEYTLTIGSKTGVTGITVKRGSTTLSNGAKIYHHESLTITASAATGYNNPTVTSPITVSGNVNTNNYITTGSIKTYTLTIGSKTGVTGVTVKRGTTTLSNGATISHFDSLVITASASTGYNNPSVTSPVSVTGNVNTNNYITAGTIKSYKLTIGSKTGVSSITVKRGSTTLSNGATINHFDTLTITATAATGYNNPSVTSSVTVTGNVTASSYVTAGTRKSYTLTIGTPPTGVSSITVKRGTTTLSNGAKIYHHENLTITARASTGYNNPTVTSPITVSGNVNTNNYVSAGTRKSYTVRLVSVLGTTETTINTISVYHGDSVPIPTIDDTGYSPNSYFIEKNSGNNTNITSNRTIYVYVQTSIQHSRVSFSNGSYVKNGNTYTIKIRMHLDPRGGGITLLVSDNNPTSITLYPNSYVDLVLTRNTNSVFYIQQSPYNHWSYYVYN